MYQPPSITQNLIQGLYIAPNVQNKPQFKGQTCLPSIMQNIKLILGPALGYSDEHYMCLNEHHAFIIIRLLLLFASFKATSQFFMPQSILCIFLPCSKTFFYILTSCSLLLHHAQQRFFFIAPLKSSLKCTQHPCIPSLVITQCALA